MAASLLGRFEKFVDSITLIPSDGGRFEVTINGNLVYSKLSTYRHANPGEVEDLVQKYIQEGKK